MSNMVARHVPAAAKSRALGLSFTGFHTGMCCFAEDPDMLGPDVNLATAAMPAGVLLCWHWLLFKRVGYLGLHPKPPNGITLGPTNMHDKLMSVHPGRACNHTLLADTGL